MNDNNGWVKWVVILVISGMLLKQLRDLFGDSPAEQAEEEQEAKEEIASIRFSDSDQVPELWSANPWNIALASLTPSEVARVVPSDARRKVIGEAVAAFYHARGTFNDDEDKAISAFTRLENWWELLLFCTTFVVIYKTTVGAYGASFLDTEERAVIVRTVENLRKIKLGA